MQRPALALAWMFLAMPVLAVAQTATHPEIPLDDSATPAQIRTLLQSSDMREQAWGGWLASSKNLPDMIPLLERVVTTHRVPLHFTTK